MKRKYWILFHHDICQVCGDDSGYRERVYDKPKPENPFKRHVTEKGGRAYCGCMDNEFR